MRKPRVLMDRAVYHVSARINRKEMLLEPAKTKSLFLDVIAKAKKRYSFRIDNFTIMGNHFHLIVQPENGASLSRIMQWLLGVFAQTYNRLHGLTGHVWGERFFSRILRTLREYVAASDYVDNNPVRAGLVGRCADWPFGGQFFRERGIARIIDPLPGFLSFLLPLNHRRLIKQNLID